jgi:hypothetical protein
MKNYCVDIETLGTESTAVILSIAYVPFSFDEKPDYVDLLGRAKFIKLDVEQQLRDLKRTVDPGTINWWEKQCDMVRQKSFIKSNILDCDVAAALNTIKSDIGATRNTWDNKDIIFWARGSLDQVVFDSLCKQVLGDMMIPFSNWRDIRTAIDLLYDDSVSGYCNVAGFNKDVVLKHDPVHDAAYDVLQLLSGNLT